MRSKGVAGGVDVPSRFLRASIRDVTSSPVSRAVTGAVEVATSRVNRVSGMAHMLAYRGEDRAAAYSTQGVPSGVPLTGVRQSPGRWDMQGWLVGVRVGGRTSRRRSRSAPRSPCGGFWRTVD
ncbi:hypothetical protein DMH15_26485 [Streptomyces sp. WAC 06725]|nr:hypothetical protein DMH15_26485 [Streptomyces sp. WAC 06725]